MWESESYLVLELIHLKWKQLVPSWNWNRTYTHSNQKVLVWETVPTTRRISKSVSIGFMQISFGLTQDLYTYGVRLGFKSERKLQSDSGKDYDKL